MKLDFPHSSEDRILKPIKPVIHNVCEEVFFHWEHFGSEQVVCCWHCLALNSISKRSFKWICLSRGLFIVLPSRKVVCLRSAPPSPPCSREIIKNEKNWLMEKKADYSSTGFLILQDFVDFCYCPFSTYFNPCKPCPGLFACLRTRHCLEMM